jgi:hypothetical protein
MSFFSLKKRGTTSTRPVDISQLKEAPNLFSMARIKMMRSPRLNRKPWISLRRSLKTPSKARTRNQLQTTIMTTKTRPHSRSAPSCASMRRKKRRPSVIRRRPMRRPDSSSRPRRMLKSRHRSSLKTRFTWSSRPRRRLRSRHRCRPRRRKKRRRLRPRSRWRRPGRRG